MTSYSCLFVGVGNLVLTRQTFEAATDHQAMEKARDLFRHSPVSPDQARRLVVWCDDRRVGA